MAHPKRPPLLIVGASPVLAVAAACVLGVTSASAAGSVSSVTGSAFGYETANITLFGGAQNAVSPTPSVSLKPDASNSPQTGSASTGIIQYGPATLFTSDAITVSTKGSLGASGSVTSTSTVQNENKATTQTSSHSEQFTADSISSSCSASPSGTTAGVTVTNGTVATKTDSNGNVLSSAAVPANPAPGFSINGQIDLSATDTETFTDIFNDQTVSGGTLTVNALHEVLHGPTAKGDVFVGQSVCGTNATTAAVSSSNPGSGVAGAGTSGASSPGTPATGSVGGGGLNTGALAAIGGGAVVVLGSAAAAVAKRIRVRRNRNRA